MTSQSSYTSSKRMSSSAIVRSRLEKNDPQNIRPKSYYAPKWGKRRPHAAGRLTGITDRTPLRQQRVSKKAFYIPVVASFVDPPPPQKKRCVAVGESAQGTSIIRFGSPPIRPRLSHRFPVSPPRLKKQTIRGCQTNIVNSSAAVSAPVNGSAGNAQRFEYRAH